MKHGIRLLLVIILLWPAAACHDLYSDVLDSRGLGVLIVAPPVLAGLSALSDSNSILLAPPVLISGWLPAPTITAYIGLDSTIQVSGTTVTGHIKTAAMNEAAGGYLFDSLPLPMGETYRIIVVAQNALGSSVQQIVKATYDPIALGVYGQVNLTSNVPGAGLTGLTTPTGVVASAGGVYVVDYGNDRVLFYEGSSTTAMRVYGDGGGSPTATSLSDPLGVAVDAGGVYVVDSGYHRVLYYAGSSTTASRVYGQGDENTTDRFVTGTINKGGRSKTSLCAPMGVAVGASGIYVADSQNNRVLHYPGTSIVADRVYGQSGDFTTANSTNPPSRITLNGPWDVATDSSGVYIADTSNVRVLHYPGTSTVADRVYGQGGNFTTKTAGLGTTGLEYPYGVAIDESGVYIADSQNNRVLHYWGASTTATGVYGQGGVFTTGDANKGGTTVATSLSAPYRVSSFNGRVYIADHGNHRVLWY